MKRKKRIEAWCELLNNEPGAVHLDRKVVAKWAEMDAPIYGPAKVVRLVEYDAAKEAVVRAAVRWLYNPKTWQDLATAVEKLQK